MCCWNFSHRQPVWVLPIVVPAFFQLERHEMERRREEEERARRPPSPPPIELAAASEMESQIHDSAARWSQRNIAVLQSARWHFVFNFFPISINVLSLCLPPTGPVWTRPHSTSRCRSMACTATTTRRRWVSSFEGFAEKWSLHWTIWVCSPNIYLRVSKASTSHTVLQESALKIEHIQLFSVSYSEHLFLLPNCLLIIGRGPAESGMCRSTAEMQLRMKLELHFEAKNGGTVQR